MEEFLRYCSLFLGAVLHPDCRRRRYRFGSYCDCQSISLSFVVRIAMCKSALSATLPHRDSSTENRSCRLETLWVSVSVADLLLAYGSHNFVPSVARVGGFATIMRLSGRCSFCFSFIFSASIHNTSFPLLSVGGCFAPSAVLDKWR